MTQAEDDKSALITAAANAQAAAEDLTALQLAAGRQVAEPSRGKQLPKAGRDEGPWPWLRRHRSRDRFVADDRQELDFF